MNIEIEVRSKIDDFSKIKDALNKIGAVFIDSEKQIDKIFGASKFLDSEHKIIEGGIVARIREIKDKRTLELKEILREKGGIELSCPVSSIKIAEKMLKKLDFEEAFTVSKLRESYSYKDFTICLDNVEQLGNFIEVEKIILEDGKEEKDKARNECMEVLKVLSPNAEIENRKYGDLMQDLINQRKNIN